LRAQATTQSMFTLLHNGLLRFARNDGELRVRNF
jgi:hypothetical protein